MKINGQDFNLVSIKGYSTEVQKLTGYIKQLHTEEENLSDTQLNQTPITNMVNEIEKAKPQITSFRGTVENSFNNVDTNGFKEKLQSAVEAIKAKLKELKIEKYLNATGSTKQLNLINAKILDLKEKLKQAMSGEIHLDTTEIEKTEAELEKLNNQKAKLENQSGGGSFFTSLTSKIKSAGSYLKQNIKSTLSWKNGFSQINKATVSVKNNIKQMGSKMKSGLKQVLKYAMALFSLRSIYTLLSSSANSWLSSQNAQAQQLSANIDYMKYAMRKCICSNY